MFDRKVCFRPAIQEGDHVFIDRPPLTGMPKKVRSRRRRLTLRNPKGWSYSPSRMGPLRLFLYRTKPLRFPKMG